MFVAYILTFSNCFSKFCQASTVKKKHLLENKIYSNSFKNYIISQYNALYQTTFHKKGFVNISRNNIRVLYRGYTHHKNVFWAIFLRKEVNLVYGNPIYSGYCLSTFSLLKGKWGVDPLDWWFFAMALDYSLRRFDPVYKTCPPENFLNGAHSSIEYSHFEQWKG